MNNYMNPINDSERDGVLYLKDYLDKYKRDELEIRVSGLTLEILEEQINNSKFVSYKFYNELSRRNKGMPMLIDIFYDFLFAHGRIPTFVEFARRWIKKVLYSYTYMYLKNDKDFIRGLYERASKSYASIIRDIHLTYYLKSRMKVGKIIFHRYLDSRNQIDILIVNNGFYGLKLYTKTEAGEANAEDKKTRNIIPFSNVNYIPVTIDVFNKDEIKKSIKTDSNNKYDVIYLYDNKHIKYIINEINKFLLKKRLKNKEKELEII